MYLGRLLAILAATSPPTGKRRHSVLAWLVFVICVIAVIVMMIAV